MTVGRRVRRILVVIVEVVLISWTLLFLAEYFGWRLFREAGGTAIEAVAARR